MNTSFTSIMGCPPNRGNLNPRQIRRAIDDFIEVYNPEAAAFEWRKDSVHQVQPKHRYAEIRK